MVTPHVKENQGKIAWKQALAVVAFDPTWFVVGVDRWDLDAPAYHMRAMAQASDASSAPRESLGKYAPPATCGRHGGANRLDYSAA